jgi:hypothetical protein
LVHGHRTAEAEIEQKAAAAGRKLVRAMIRTTMAWALKGRIPPEVGHAAHKEMMAAYNAQRTIQQEAAARRREKVARHADIEGGRPARSMTSRRHEAILAAESARVLDHLGDDASNVDPPTWPDRHQNGANHRQTVTGEHVIDRTTAHDGVRRPAPRRDVEDDQHRAASKQLAEIIARYGTAHVIHMIVDIIAPPDGNASPRALRERRILLGARRSLMEGQADVEILYRWAEEQYERLPTSQRTWFAAGSQ